jgi:hypothetical protein
LADADNGHITASSRGVREGLGVDLSRLAQMRDGATPSGAPSIPKVSRRRHGTSQAGFPAKNRRRRGIRADTRKLKLLRARRRSSVGRAMAVVSHEEACRAIRAAMRDLRRAGYPAYMVSSIDQTRAFQRNSVLAACRSFPEDGERYAWIEGGPEASLVAVREALLRYGVRLVDDPFPLRRGGWHAGVLFAERA